MLVYEGVKSGFIDDVNLNKIVDKIYDKYKSVDSDESTVIAL